MSARAARGGSSGGSRVSPGGSAVSPVSLVVGEEELLAERAVAALVASARAALGTAGGEEQGQDTAVREVAAAGLGPGDLASLTSPSLFGGGCVLVLRGAGDLGKQAAEELVACAADPPPDVAIVVTHPGGAKGRALLATLVKHGAQVTECPKLTRPADRMAFIRAEFRRAARTVEDSGVRAILDAVGPDLRDIASACDQLAADTTGVIDQTVVARYYRGRAEATGFAVADRAVEGRLAEALELLRWALAIGVPPVLITSGLAQAVRLLGRVGGAPRGRGEAALAADFGAPPWRIDKARQQLRGWTPEGVARAMAAIAAADAQVKGEAASPGYALERVVRTVVTCRARR